MPEPRKAKPSPMNRIGQAHDTSGVPKPLASTTPMPTAIRPPKIDPGVVQVTMSGHWVWMTYAPPEAQNPPSPITMLAPTASSVKQNVNSSHEAAEPKYLQSGLVSRDMATP